MEDLSISVPSGGTVFPLGGGNPAHIPEVQALLQESAQALLDNRALFNATLETMTRRRGTKCPRLAGQ